MLAHIRSFIREADPEAVEEMTGRRSGLVSRGDPLHRRGLQGQNETDFAKGALLDDPLGLFNFSLEGNIRRAVDITKEVEIDGTSLKGPIRAALA